MTSVRSRDAACSVTEEIANTAVQGVGTLLSVAGLAFLVHLAMGADGILPVAAAAVYGATLVFAFLSSTLYHGSFTFDGPRAIKAERILRTVDHSAIFFLIAGTYTPLALLVLSDHSGWILAAAVWVLALAGAALRVVRPHRVVKLRIGLYLALGWLVLAWAKPLFDSIGVLGSALVAAGGLTYSAGVAFYVWRKLRFHEAIWHLFVIAGSAFFFAVIALYAIPGRTP